MTTILRPKPRYMHVNSSISSVECIDYVTYLSSRLGLYPYEVKWLLSGDPIELLEEYKLSETRKTAIIRQPKYEAKYVEDVYMADISPSNKKMASPVKVTRTPINRKELHGDSVSKMKQSDSVSDYANNIHIPRINLVHILRNRSELTTPSSYFKKINPNLRIKILTHPNITRGAFAVYEENEELFIMFDRYLTFIHQFMAAAKQLHFKSLETFISLSDFLELSIDTLTFHGFTPIKFINPRVREFLVDRIEMLMDACLILPSINPMVIVGVTDKFLQIIANSAGLLDKIAVFKNLENLSVQIRNLLV